MGSRRIKYNTWPELLEAVKAYDDKGIKTEINGFEDLSEKYTNSLWRGKA